MPFRIKDWPTVCEKGCISLVGKQLDLVIRVECPSTDNVPVEKPTAFITCLECKYQMVREAEEEDLECSR